MLGRLRIRGKLALVMALPLVAAALLTLPGVLGAVERAQRADEIGRVMQAASPVTSLVSEIRQERLLSLGYLFEVVDRSRLVTQSTEVVDRLVDVREDAPAGYLRGGPAGSALAAAEALTELRTLVLAREASAEQVSAEFGAVVTTLIDSLRLLDGVDLATSAARNVATLDASLRANEAASQATDQLLVIAATGSDAAAGQYAVALALAGDHSSRFTRYASPEQLELLALMEGAYAARDASGLGIALGPDPFQATAGQPAAQVFGSLASLSQLGRFVETKIITDVLIDVEAQSRAALRTAYLVAVGALLVVLAVVVLTAMLARTVVRPLLDLTSSAHRVAQVADAELARIADEETESGESLQFDPVWVDTADEIGDLGRAFNRVQTVAVRLVERQLASRRNVALMFGYLGRRTQNLVGRQLALIDQLERDESDHERLEQLYRLDHISSRLRRNAGSLVVLSGATSADEHVAPLPLADLVRLALGEIEDYGRVDIEVPAGITLVPAVTGDLVLVLAELMENATSFSPPHTRVRVCAATLGYGGGAEISIVDHGIGMSPDRLAEENSRLARRERLDLAPTEVLGLFVVGRLARRHGLRVALSATPGGGVTAIVEVAQRLLVPPEPPRAIDAPVLAGEPVLTGPEWSLVPAGPGQLARNGFDLTALSRAGQILLAGRPWNAFAVPELPAVATEPDGPPSTEPSTEPSPEPAPSGPGGLRRRVPGGSLEPSPPSPVEQPQLRSKPDPEQARELVEQLESGVARALDEIQEGRDTKEHDDRE